MDGRQRNWKEAQNVQTTIPEGVVTKEVVIHRGQLQSDTGDFAEEAVSSFANGVGAWITLGLIGLALILVFRGLINMALGRKGSQDG